MAYNKVTYVDGVTPLNANTLNKNEIATEQLAQDVESISSAIVEVDNKIEQHIANHPSGDSHTHANKIVLDGISQSKVTEWNNKSNFDGNYNSLTNKPTIPTVDVNKAYVDTELAKKSPTTHTHTDLHTHANKTVIDGISTTKVTEWDSKATTNYVDTKIAEAQLGGGEVDLSGYATKTDLETKVDKVSGKSLSTNDYTSAEKTKLAGLSNYTHPNDANTRHVTDTEKTTWNNKANASHTHTKSNITDFSHRHNASEIDGLGSGGDVDLTGYATETFVMDVVGGKIQRNVTNEEYTKLLNGETVLIESIGKSETYDEDKIYAILDAPDTDVTDLKLTGSKLDLVNKDGVVIGNGVTLPASGGGSSITVENNLTSTSATNALAAAQGKVLDDKITVLNASSIKYETSGTTPVEPPSTNGSLSQSDVKKLSNIYECYVNLCPLELELKGKYYDANTGNLISSSNYGSTPLIEVDENTYYHKNITSHTTFWDKDKEFISGSNSASFETPKGCTYVRSSSILNMEGKISIVKTDRNLTFNGVPHTARYCDRFLKPIVKHNAEIPLLIETFDNSNQPTHPKLLSFAKSWNGYKYWMSYTPYPNGQAATENPCIAVSNDLFYWTTPDGLINPIVPSPPNAGMSNYNSDSHLVFRSDLNRIECWYREVTNGSTETIKRKTSTNGIDWSEFEVLHIENVNALKAICPTVIHEDNKYKIWIATDEKVKYCESLDGTNWIDKGFVVDAIKGDLKTWHFDIIKTKKGYEMINYVGRSENGTITHYISQDGITWTQSDFLMMPSTNINSFDYKSLYRSTFIFEDGLYKMIYASVSNSNKWQLSLSISLDDDINTLNGIKSSDSIFLNKPTRKNPLGRAGDSLFDSDSNKMIFCVNKNGSTAWVDANGTVV